MARASCSPVMRSSSVRPWRRISEWTRQASMAPITQTAGATVAGTMAAAGAASARPRTRDGAAHTFSPARATSRARRGRPAERASRPNTTQYSDSATGVSSICPRGDERAHRGVADGEGQERGDEPGVRAGPFQ